MVPDEGIDPRPSFANPLLYCSVKSGPALGTLPFRYPTELRTAQAHDASRLPTPRALPGIQTTKNAWIPEPLSHSKVRTFGADEGIRTLDPNLGNPSGRFSLQQVLNRKTTKNPYTSITYVDTVFRVHTLESPWISILLLPPCFPSHAAPARGSRFGGSRAPPP